MRLLDAVQNVSSVRFLLKNRPPNYDSYVFLDSITISTAFQTNEGFYQTMSTDFETKEGSYHTINGPEANVAHEDSPYNSCKPNSPY